MPRKPQGLNIENCLANWQGYMARVECYSASHNPHSDRYARALWYKGWTDADNGLERPESCPPDCYLIIDDVVGNKTGFVVMFGDPVRAIGTTRSEHRLYREALASIPAGETVYRVRLARRHGKHSAILITR
jgi:ribosome modulation factor